MNTFENWQYWKLSSISTQTKFRLFLEVSNQILRKTKLMRV